MSFSLLTIILAKGFFVNIIYYAETVPFSSTLLRVLTWMDIEVWPDVSSTPIEMIIWFVLFFFAEKMNYTDLFSDILYEPNILGINYLVSMDYLFLF